MTENNLIYTDSNQIWQEVSLLYTKVEFDVEKNDTAKIFEMKKMRT